MQWTFLAGLGAGMLLGALGSVQWLRFSKRSTVATQATANGQDCARLDAGHRVHVLEHVLDLAGVGTYTWDMATDRLSWSSRSYAMFGQALDSPMTFSLFRQLIHPGDLAAVESALAVSSSKRTDYQMHYRLLLEGNAVRYIHSSGRFVYDALGNPKGLNGVVIDVTEATEMQLAKQRHETELMVMADNLPDILGRFDRDGRFRYISNKVEKVTGQPASFYIGKKLTEIGIDYALAMRWNAVLDSARRYRSAREFDFEFTDQHGQVRFFITRAMPLFDANDNLVNILTITTDHTERERVAAHTRAVGESLRLADRRKNQYLATLAHELRGPLAPIASAVQLIKLSPHRPVREKAREVIERQIASLSSLVNDLMEVGRISAGKIELEKKPLTLRRVIEQAVESIKPHSDSKCQALSVDLPAEDLWIDGDELRLTQVFINLLTNASKYSSNGAGIAIDTVRIDDKVSINIRDQGIGLTQGQMVEIFDIFVQVHAVGIQSQGGLGIGLSLVRNLVELHGGDVTVSSPGIGGGSCFTVTLPTTADRPAAAPPVEAEGAVPAPLRVLVVDDNVDSATALATLLEAMDHQAFTAFNGRDAIRIAQEQSVDLAFVDLGLPDISGVQVALTIRATAWGRSLPLYALTGLGRDEDYFLTRSARFTGHIVKPLNMADLHRILAQVAEGISA